MEWGVCVVSDVGFELVIGFSRIIWTSRVLLRHNVAVASGIRRMKVFWQPFLAC